MYFYILLKRGKVNLTDVYNASGKTHKNKDDKRVLCSFVNIKHVLHKKGRKKKQITFHIKSFTL
jgi:hypothetical protein